MGSFTSMSKVIPATDTDKDIENDFCRIKEQFADVRCGVDEVDDKYSLDNFLDYCSERLTGLPTPFSRKWKNCNVENYRTECSKFKENEGNILEENIRVLQWNVLSQSKSHDFIIAAY